MRSSPGFSVRFSVTHFSLLAVVAFASLQAHAQDGGSAAAATPPPQESVTASSSAGLTEPTATPGSASAATPPPVATAVPVTAATATPVSTTTTVIPSSGGTTASAAASGANASQIIGIGASVVMGGFMTSQCVPPTSNMMACAMALSSFMQAASLAGNANNSGQVAQQLASGTTGSSGTTGATTTDGTTVGPASLPSGTSVGNTITSGPLAGLPDPTGTIAQAYKVVGQNMAANGIAVSADGQTLTMPNGSTVPTSSLGSASGAAAAGLSGADIAAGQNALAQGQALVNSKIASGALSAEGGGGGGGKGSGSGGDDGSGGGAGGAGMAGNPFANKNGKNGKASVSGMSKKLGNDNIGVAGDDIFEMITRRYQDRDKHNNFLKY